MDTSVRWAPSSTTTSTVSASDAGPTWSTTTTASLSSRACTSRCVAVGPVPGTPSIRTLVAADATAPRGTVTTVASANEDHAAAAVRSPGRPTVPSRASSRPTISTVTSGGFTTVTWTPPVARPSPVASNSGANRGSGLNRHSSSRPVGTGKSASSNEVRRSAREA